MSTVLLLAKAMAAASIAMSVLFVFAALRLGSVADGDAE